MGETRTFRRQLQAGNILEQPLADGAIGIVVVAVHVGIVDRTVLGDRVPALPDRGRATLHLIEPARHLAVQEHFFGEIEHSEPGERRQKGRRADEAGADHAIGFLDHAAEIGFARLFVVIGNEIMQERQRPGGLVVMRDPARGRKELGAEGGADLV